jgi:alpha-N-arabinofuranosidase
MAEAKLTRRAALATAAGAALACAGRFVGASGDEKAGAALDVLLNEPVGTVRPELYSQFAEHIGGVIYDGIWVGPESKIANIDGIRRDLVEHVRNLGPVVVRWPGGCYADKYHWRDGVGPIESRPKRLNRWRETVEPNHFGTREFMRFCRECGVKPYFAANVGTARASEFQDWVEYCNGPAGMTSLSSARVANGDVEPYGVRYWGVGNESWGCGGRFTPEDYCTEYRRFTEGIPGFGVPLYLIAAGPNGNDVDWTRRFFKKWADYARAPIHGWAPHYYCGTTGHALKFDRDQWYAMLAKANRMEALIVDQWAALAEFDPQHKVKLVIDEWGAWHPAGTEINPNHLFEQMGCLRDALVAALTLDTFNRHAEKVDMANVAQLVNNLHSLFLADGPNFVATPNYHVFTTYRHHHGGTSLRVAAEADDVSFRVAGREEKLFRVAGSATVKGRALTLTVVHTHAEQPVEIDIRLRGGSASEARATVLTHAELNAHNTFERPDVVVPRSGEAPVIQQGSLRAKLPPASVTRLDVTLA